MLFAFFFFVKEMWLEKKGDPYFIANTLDKEIEIFMVPIEILPICIVKVFGIRNFVLLIFSTHQNDFCCFRQSDWLKKSFILKFEILCPIRWAA